MNPLPSTTDHLIVSVNQQSGPVNTPSVPITQQSGIVSTPNSKHPCGNDNPPSVHVNQADPMRSNAHHKFSFAHRGEK